MAAKPLANLKKLLNPELLTEWSLLVHLSLIAAKELECEGPLAKDPFVALKHAKMVAYSIAHSQASRHFRHQ